MVDAGGGLVPGPARRRRLGLRLAVDQQRPEQRQQQRRSCMGGITDTV